MALLNPAYELHLSGARGVFPWTESTGTRVVELPKNTSSRVSGLGVLRVWLPQIRRYPLPEK